MDTGEMRELIIGLDTFNLAEQAGIVCDTLDDIVVPDVDLSVAQFIFEADEPYEVYFEWRFGDVCAGFSFLADRDESSWFVNDRRRRLRRPISGRYIECASEFIEELGRRLGSRTTDQGV